MPLKRRKIRFSARSKRRCVRSATNRHAYRSRPMSIR
jgi:hypothetical protein